MAAPPLVAFDLGGVLVRLCPSWEEGCRAAGVAFRAVDADAHRETERRALLDAYQEGRLACADFFAAYARALGGRYSAEEVRRVHDAWLLGEYAGVGALVDALHAQGVETGVLSNTNASHWARLQPSDGRAPDFPTAARTRHPHASHLLGASKPSAAIYERFEELTRRDGREIVFFDDVVENVDAARRSGWTAHRIDPTGDTAGQIARQLRDAGLLS